MEEKVKKKKKKNNTKTKVHILKSLFL